MSPHRSIATTHGQLDDHYMSNALDRAGINFSGDKISIEGLSDGRSGARVDRVVCGENSWVVKQAPVSTWQREYTGNQGEGPMWLSGMFDELPQSIECPILDAAYHEENRAWWLLMRDVSTGICQRGKFGEAEVLILWRGLSRLHASHWGHKQRLHELPIVDVVQTTTVHAEPAACVAGAPPRENWVPRVAEEFGPLKVLLPSFLELISPQDADFYLSLTQNRDWHRTLDLATPTLLHGDVRRASL